MYMDQEGTTLATEIFRELKASAKRWFIAFLVMCGIEVGTVAGFLWYISLPVEETTISQDMEDIEGSNISQKVSDEYGTSPSNDNTETESDQK